MVCIEPHRGTGRTASFSSACIALALCCDRARLARELEPEHDPAKDISATESRLCYKAKECRRVYERRPDALVAVRPCLARFALALAFGDLFVANHLRARTGGDPPNLESVGLSYGNSIRDQLQPAIHKKTRKPPRHFARKPSQVLHRPS